MYQLSPLPRRNIETLACQAYLRHQSALLRSSMHTQQMLPTSVWRAYHHGQVCTALTQARPVYFSALELSLFEFDLAVILPLCMQDKERTAIVKEWTEQMSSSELDEGQEQDFVDAFRFAQKLCEGCAKSSSFRRQTMNQIMFLPMSARYGKYFGKKNTPTN
jgi:hypothetical protein